MCNGLTHNQIENENTSNKYSVSCLGQTEVGRSLGLIWDGSREETLLSFCVKTYILYQDCYDLQIIR